MDTVTINNLSTSPFAANFFSVVAPGMSKTLTLKTVDADDQNAGFLHAARLGAVITLNGTLVAGCEAFTNNGTLNNDTRAVTVSAASNSVDIALMSLSYLPVGGMLYFSVYAPTLGQDVTLTADGTDLIDGLATYTVTAPATVTVRLKKISDTNWAVV